MRNARKNDTLTVNSLDDRPRVFCIRSTSMWTRCPRTKLPVLRTTRPGRPAPLTRPPKTSPRGTSLPAVARNFHALCETTSSRYIGLCRSRWFLASDLPRDEILATAVKRTVAREEPAARTNRVQKLRCTRNSGVGLVNKMKTATLAACIAGIHATPFPSIIPEYIAIGVPIQ